MNSGKEKKLTRSVQRFWEPKDRTLLRERVKKKPSETTESVIYNRSLNGGGGDQGLSSPQVSSSSEGGITSRPFIEKGLYQNRATPYRRGGCCGGSGDVRGVRVPDGVYGVGGRGGR